MKNKVFQFFNQCIPVRGAKRSIIYDLNRHDFDFIPNEMVDFIEYSTNRTKDEIINYFGVENKKIVKEYFDFLESKEYCFWIDKDEAEFFPKLDLVYYYPSIINNCVIEIDKTSSNLLEEVLLQLKSVHCHHVSLIFIGKITLKFIKSVIEKFYNSNIKTIQLVIKNNSYGTSFTEKILDLDARIFDIYITNAKSNCQKIYEKSKQVTFTKLKDSDAINSSYVIYKENFRVNIFLFSESLKYNSYYNKKVSITKEGDIKNCLLHNKIFGNILNCNLKAIVTSEEFQFSWNINKDKIKICQDCEFRYMCVDSCPLIFDADSKLFYRSVPCNYNPYKNEFYV